MHQRRVGKEPRQLSVAVPLHFFHSLYHGKAITLSGVIQNNNIYSQLFVYLFAPLCHLIKENDLQSFRLENGIKLWQPLWEYKNPTARCFSALCRPRPVGKTPFTAAKISLGDIFAGSSTQLISIRDFIKNNVNLYFQSEV